MADPSGRTEYLEATLGLVKRLEISKELIPVADLGGVRGVQMHPPYPP